MKQLLVVVHDAGGAEVIAAYLKAQKKKANYAAYATGPAARIFKREGIVYTPAPKSHAGMHRLMQGASELLTATGWMTDTERIALSAAKEAGLKTRVYLESWNRYRERFGYPAKGWQKNLPDELWVGDRDAERLAKRFFPKTRVRFVANEYFKRIKARVSKNSGNAILFLSDVSPHAAVALEELLQECAQQGVKDRIRIRFHPADDRRRFDSLIAAYRLALSIEKSPEKDLVTDLAEARVVVGAETVALAVASIAGKQAVSIVPKGTQAYLPQQKLRRVSSGKEAARLIIRL